MFASTPGVRPRRRSRRRIGLGVYLQAEAPAWVDDWGTGTVTKPPAIGRDPEVTDFLRAELRRMSEAYGNHPSFLLCAIGNEFGMQSTDWERVNAMVEEIKTHDPRRLYAGCGARKQLPADDFWFTHDSGASTRGVGPAQHRLGFRQGRRAVARAADRARDRSTSGVSRLRHVAAQVHRAVAAVEPGALSPRAGCQRTRRAN